MEQVKNQSTVRREIAAILARAKKRLSEAERKSDKKPQTTDNKLALSQSNGIVSQHQTNGDLL